MCKLSVAASQEFGKTWGALARESQFDGDDDDEGALNGFNLRCAVGVPSGDEDEESESSGGAEREGEWEEWRGDPARVTCLFCEASYGGMEDLLMHMTAVHDFDFRHVRNALRLDFYGQVKMVNYVRRKVHLGECIHCQDRFDSRDEMLEHMAEEEHFRPPDDAFEWNRPGKEGGNKLLFNRKSLVKSIHFADFLFPTYENDTFLCRLDDDIYDAKGGRSPIGPSKSGPASPSPASAAAPVEAEEIEGAEELLKNSILRDDDFRRSITSGH